MTPRFSIVVPVLDLRNSLPLLLRCLEAQTFPRAEFECIVVDDGSTDGTRDLLAASRPPFTLKVLHNDITLGRSVTRNIGCRHARGDILVFLDGDMLPAPSWLAEYDTAFAAGDGDVISGGRYSIAVDPRNAVAELAARLRVPAPDLLGADLASQFGALARRARLGQYPLPLYERLERELADVCRGIPDSVLCAFSFITSNVAVYRRRFESTKGFCSFVVRLQDTELGLQLWEAGCRFGFAGGATAYHLFHPVFVDLDTNYRDVLSLFYRHPYKLVLKMACWGLHRAPSAAKPRLTELAACSVPDLEITQEFAETFGRPAPVNCRYSLASMVSYAAEQSRLTRDEISRYLQLGITQGLYADRRNGDIYLDRQHTINWLQNNTPYREADLRQSCCLNNAAVLERAGSADRAASFRCHGRYEVHVPTSVFDGCAGEATVQLPVPVPHARQTNLELQSFHSDWVAERRERDYLLYSWGVDAGAEDVVLGYEFTCDLHESASAARDDDDDALAAWRLSTLPPGHREKAGQILRMVGRGADGPFVQAQAIYDWILAHYAFRESAMSNLLVFDIGVGPCHHAAKLFIELCRVAGIPAREQCGALLQKVVETGETQKVESVERGYSPFMHTWAEFHDRARGWVPVEFLGWMLGARTLTPRNAADGPVRARAEANTGLYDRYFFGNLDPFRVRAPSSANKLRTYPTLKADATWDLVYRSSFETRHRLACTIERLPAASLNGD